MQIARNALALGHFGQVFDFFVRLAQLAVHAIALGEKDVTGADDHRKNRRPKKLPTIDVQKQPFDQHRDAANRE